MFVQIFTVIFNWYLKIEKWLHPLPDQLFVFDDDKLYVRGFIGDNKGRFRVDHFKVDGDYTIKVNGDPLRFIKNVKTDGFDPTVTYFVTSNFIIRNEESTIEIVDNILDKKKTFKLIERIPIDYIALINEMN